MSHRNHEKNPRPSNTGVHSSKTEGGDTSRGGVSARARAYGLVNGTISRENSKKQPLSRFAGQFAERRAGVAVVTVNPSSIKVVRQNHGGKLPNPEGVGVRGKVKGRSDRSRRRLVEALSRIDLEKLVGWQRKDSRWVKTVFITLTYPKDFPRPERAKRDLGVLRKRLGYHYGLKWGIWVLEFQKRGAPHFHIVINLNEIMDLEEFRPWMSKTWYDIADTGDPKHLKAGTQVLAVYVKDGVASLMGYMAAYMGKIEQTMPKDPSTGEIIETGRTWGIWGRDSVPFETVGVVVLQSYEDWEEFKRRVAAKYKGKSKYLSKVDEFVWWGGALLWGDGRELIEELAGDLKGVVWRQGEEKKDSGPVS